MFRRGGHRRTGRQGIRLRVSGFVAQVKRDRIKSNRGIEASGDGVTRCGALAFFAQAVKFQAVVADLEAGLFVDTLGDGVGEFHIDIKNTPAPVADKVVVGRGIPVEAVNALGKVELQNAAAFFELFQVAVHRSQTDAGNFLTHLLVNPFGAGV